MNELALFAGAGGGILGGTLLGWRCVCAVKCDPYARDVLVARQNDGCLPPFPVWDDIRTFDGRPWRGLVDVVSGGFPCQDISAAGRGAGINGERSGLWREMARVVGEVRPRFVLVENSPMLVRRGLARVLGDLAALGYDARWGVVGAHHAGAPHRRDRIWIVAHTDRTGREEQRRPLAVPEEDATAERLGKDVPDAENAEPFGRGHRSRRRKRRAGNAHAGGAARVDWWEAEPGVGRVVDVCPNRVDRLRCLGNGQVPAVVALAWRFLSGDE